MMTEAEKFARSLFMKHCQVGGRGALERYGESAAITAIVEAIGLSKTALTELLNAELSDSYDCTRVWQAWSVGTMGEDDFAPLSDRVDQIADGIVDCHLATIQSLAE